MPSIINFSFSNKNVKRLHSDKPFCLKILKPGLSSSFTLSAHTQPHSCASPSNDSLPESSTQLRTPCDDWLHEQQTRTAASPTPPPQLGHFPSSPDPPSPAWYSRGAQAAVWCCRTPPGWCCSPGALRTSSALPHGENAPLLASFDRCCLNGWSAALTSWPSRTFSPRTLKAAELNPEDSLRGFPSGGVRCLILLVLGKQQCKTQWLTSSWIQLLQFCCSTLGFFPALLLGPVLRHSDPEEQSDPSREAPSSEHRNLPEGGGSVPHTYNTEEQFHHTFIWHPQKCAVGICKSRSINVTK